MDMKVSNGYFIHPASGELIRPGEIYEEFYAEGIDRCEPRYVPDTEAEGGGPEFYGSVKAGKNAGDFEGTKPLVYELADKSFTELRKIAKEKGVAGYSKISKEELTGILKEIISREQLPGDNALISEKTDLYGKAGRAGIGGDGIMSSAEYPCPETEA